jgi:hypothetical protein
MLEENQMVFIVGFPRSGTTLLQSLLMTHPKIYSIPETHFFSRILREQENRSGLVRRDRFPAIKREVKEKLKYDFDMSTIMPENEVVPAKSVFLQLIHDYAHSSGMSLAGKVILEKTPAHIKHVRSISALFPGAHFVSIKRNPIASIQSYRENFTHTNNDIVHLAKRWVADYSTFMDFELPHPTQTVSVTYEELSENTEAVVEQVIRSVGLNVAQLHLSSYQKKVDQIVTPDEPWKKNNSRSINNNNEQTIARMSRFNQWIVSNLVKGSRPASDYSLTGNVASAKLATAINKIQRGIRKLR